MTLVEYTSLTLHTCVRAVPPPVPPAEQASPLCVVVRTERRRRDMPHVENDRIVETADEARAGTTGHGARYVLAISTVLSVIVVAGAFIWFVWGW